MDGLYEEIRDVALGTDTFISSANTARKVRKVVPSPELIVREKLRSWLAHPKLIKDRAREIALEKIKSFKPFRLPDDKQCELLKIYQRAVAKLI